MTDTDFAADGGKPRRGFGRTFWIANGAELCERAAYYGMFISLVRYLNIEIGFTDVEAGWVAALFSSILYFLPTFMGIMADKISFRRALIMAFLLLTVGYILLGTGGTKKEESIDREVPSSSAAAEPGSSISADEREQIMLLPEVPRKLCVIVALIIIMFGGAIVKPVISGTAAKCSTNETRARAMSIFYMVVNIGSFSGKFLAGDLNDRLGLQYINFYAAGMSFCAFLLVMALYKNPDMKGTGKTVKEAFAGLLTVMQNFRFLSQILIVAGFWAIQGQLYASMPTYLERLLGSGTKPEYLANVNPAVVVLLVIPITHMVRRFKPENAIGIGLFIIPFTALVMALSPVLESITGPEVDFGLFSLHPIVVTIIIGIGLQGLAECFLSPKFLEYASKQAPEGEVGLYLGYQHLTTFFAWLFGFVISGYLLDAYCPDPEKIREIDPAQYEQWQAAVQGQGPMPEAYAHAHYIWFVFTAIGFAAFIGLLLFKHVTRKIDEKKALNGGA